MGHREGAAGRAGSVSRQPSGNEQPRVGDGLLAMGGAARTSAVAEVSWASGTAEFVFTSSERMQVEALGGSASFKLISWR